MKAVAIARCMGAALCFSALIAAATPVLAQEPPAAAVTLAKELIVLKGGHAMLDPVVPGVIESAKNMLLQTSPMLGKELNEVAAGLHKEFDPKRDELLTQMARGYARRFTEAELKELLTFYKSPLGKKMITDEPLVIEQGMRQTQSWANAFSEQMIGRFRTDMKKKGHDL